MQPQPPHAGGAGIIFGATSVKMPAARESALKASDYWCKERLATDEGESRME